VIRGRSAAVVIERVRQLPNHRPFPPKYQPFLVAAPECAGTHRFERPHHAHFVQTDAEGSSTGCVDSELAQRLAHVKISLARGYDAETATIAIEDHPVETIGAGESLGRRQLEIDQAALHRQRHEIELAAVQSAGRHLHIRRQNDPDAIRVGVDGSGQLEIIGNPLESNPESREARQRPAVQAQIQELLRVGRSEHWQHARDEHMLGFGGRHRGLAAHVVGTDDEHAAVLARAIVVTDLGRLARALDTEMLAVPERKDAVVAGFRISIQPLRTFDRGGGQLLVDPWNELDVVLLEMLLRRPQCKVIGSDRRTPVSGDETGGVQSGCRISLALHHWEAYERLNRGHVHITALLCVFVIKCDGCLAQFRSPRSKPPRAPG
jgi:hypothetical protein